MVISNRIWAFVICILCETYGQQFTPGCSFYNGKCIYNVQLGSVESCQGVNINPEPEVRDLSGACTCNDVTKASVDLNNLQTRVDKLQKSMTDFKNQLKNVSPKTSSFQGQPDGENQKYLDILDKLHSKEDILNRTNEEVTRILQTASTEIKGLREKLKNTTGELATCQVSMGVTQTSQKASVADFTTFYCSFQQTDLCRFTQDRDDNTDWTRQSSSISSQSGPKTDHSYGNGYGYYMALKTINTPKSSAGKTISRITSPTFKPASNYCLRFWYTMFGKDVDTLNVYAKVNGGRGYPIYTRTGNVDPYWHFAQIDIGPEYTKSSFQITFEGSYHAYKVHRYTNSHYTYIYYNDDGNIAIDDFYIYNTTCNSLPAVPADSLLRRVGNETTYYTFHKTPATWYDAQVTCRKANPRSSLAAIQSASEQLFLVNFINSNLELTIAGQNGFYLNGNDVDSENNFKWTNTGYPEIVNYTNFHQGQPNNVGNIQDCLLMEYPADNYKWGDVSCTEKHPFICETMMP
ncbi:uncharacterized protein [Mytilus edulis]|uniref:uncharacterized protein n=1 Tax=Mytilus edulis TaxID=6550 RepID=UPI0039F065C8